MDRQELLDELTNLKKAHGWQAARIERIFNAFAGGLIEPPDSGEEPDRPDQGDTGKPSDITGEVVMIATDEEQRFIGKRDTSGPSGMIVHYTAGRPGTARRALNSRYTFITLSEDGDFYTPKGFAWDKWGYHTGATHESRMGSKATLGVEVINPGRLYYDNSKDVYFPWYSGKKLANGKRSRTEIESLKELHYKKDQVRISDGEANIRKGPYVPYTEQQEASLFNMALFLDKKFPEFSLDRVWGHDEVCSPTGRKTDPGACLSMTMPEFRRKLKSYA